MKFNKIKSSVSSGSALYLMLAIIGAICAGELIAMLLINFLPPLSQFITVMVDSVFMLLITFPILYFFVFRKLNEQIREIKQAGLALQESGAIYRTLVENLPDGVYKSTHEGKFVDANPAMFKMLGYESKEELLAVDIKTQLYFNPSDRETMVLHEKLEETGIFRLKKKDGSGIWVEDRGWCTLGENGEILFHEGILRDITNRRQEELERQIMHEITRGVTETGNLGELLKLIHHSLGKVIYAENCYIALHDQNTRLFSFPYFVDQFKSTPEPEEMLKSCTAYVFRTGKPLIMTPELFKQLEKQNEVGLIGAPSPSWIGVPLKTPSRTIGVIVLQHYEKENVYSEHDIQFLDSVGSQIAMAIDRWQANVGLINERLLLRTVIDNIPDSIYCKDINSRKTLANLAELHFSRTKTETEIIGKTDFDLYPKEIAEGFFADDRLVLQTGRPVINREEFLFDDKGQKRWLLTSKLPMKDEKGNIVGLVGIGRDITARRKAAEEIKRKNEELQKINAEKDKFFSIIAHDLRSPFNGFLGLTQVMAKELHNLSMEEIQKIAVNMSKSATNLYRLLENLLEWSQIQKGTFPFNPEEIHLSLIATECFELINESANNKGIETTVDIPDGLTLFADANMLQSVIRNLVSNAVKFTHKGGKVKLSARALTNNNVEISIQDTGIGMNRNMVDNLFIPDAQNNRKGTEGELSTGLGLLLCKEFIEKNRGSIRVESEEGNPADGKTGGSTFYFTVPYKKSNFTFKHKLDL